MTSQLRASTPDEVRFEVTVTRSPRGSYYVAVTQGDGEYAQTFHGKLDVALQMALPYMAHAATPDPLQAMFDEAAKSDPPTREEMLGDG